MKQAYFTSKTIEAQANAFLEQVPRKKAVDFSAGRPALLVLDMQRYFFEPESHAFVPSAPAILPNVMALAEAFSDKGLPVIYTQHVNRPEDAGMMATWWRDLLTPDHPFVGLVPEMDVSREEVLVKSQYDAFYRTDLEARLQAEDATEVVICGVVAHLCCETTARSAFMHGFQVWFVADATASYTVENHLGTLRNLGHGFGVPVLSQEVISVL
jgi:bifunctional isochorismate lyase/aryl carrier protein